VVNTIFQKETLFPFSSVLFISIHGSIALDFTAYLAIYNCAFNAALRLRSSQNFYMGSRWGWMKISNPPKIHPTIGVEIFPEKSKCTLRHLVNINRSS